MNTPANDTPSPRVEEVFTQLVRREGAADGMVVAWVAVCEVLDPASGHLSLWTITDQQSPYWKISGMLEHAHTVDEDTDDE